MRHEIPDLHNHFKSIYGHGSHESCTQNALREELKTVLDEMTYTKLAEGDAGFQQALGETLKVIPHGIYVG